ncbi:MAG: hypothetical protein IT174_11005 [Acidobacteria bacterium]|nr:hypothetical protein [Acidobacteriota bacterium]
MKKKGPAELESTVDSLFSYAYAQIAERIKTLVPESKQRLAILNLIPGSFFLHLIKGGVEFSEYLDRPVQRQRKMPETFGKHILARRGR